MEVEELYELTDWVNNEIVETGIPQKYQQLQKILIQNAQSNQQKQPFQKQRDTLIDAIHTVPLEELSLGQIDILEKLGVAQNIGKDGVNRVEGILFRNSLDIASAAQGIKQCSTEISEGVQWVKQQNELLEKIVGSEGVTVVEGQVLLRVHFSGDASVRNITDLRDWSKTWWDIARGVSMAHNQSPEALSVTGASKGSIIISLLTVYGIATTISGILLQSLKVVERYYDIKRKAQEVRELEINNREAEEALERAAQKHKEKAVEEIAGATIRELGIDSGAEGDKVAELTSSIRKLFDFIEKGGEIDFVMPENDEQDAEQAPAATEKNSLRDRFKDIRRLEREVKRLEEKDD
ncbi:MULTISPECIES: hypothetical protein [unclassified Thioalkalivibrio]|uniref:hypothetical protein n=1 Tax=unclassified Thioalkalivibrio TaxID=2621013 RepID=UPI0012DD761C|nr:MULTISPECIES: hypothetical protein [unclassified Thioalkalivibrio]